MSDPAILTCAVAGGIVTGNPNQPRTRDDVIAAALGAARAGASVVHIHARTVDGEMTQDPEDYLAIKRAEYRAFAGEVSEQDWRWYLHQA